MSNANGPDFVESTRAANDRKPTSATTIYTKKETTASFLQSSLFDFPGGDEENRTPVQNTSTITQHYRNNPSMRAS